MPGKELCYIACMPPKNVKRKVDSKKISTTKEEFLSVLKKVSQKLTPSELSPLKPKT